jgi:hypothetical protein
MRVQATLMLLLAAHLLSPQLANAGFWEMLGFKKSAPKSAFCEEALLDFSAPLDAEKLASIVDEMTNLGILAHAVTLSLYEFNPQEKDPAFTLSRLNYLNPEARSELVANTLRNVLRILPVKWDTQNLSEQKLLQKHFYGNRMGALLNVWKAYHDANQFGPLLEALRSRLTSLFESGKPEALQKRKLLYGINQGFLKASEVRGGFVLGAHPLMDGGRIEPQALAQYLRSYASENTFEEFLSLNRLYLTEENWRALEQLAKEPLDAGLAKVLQKELAEFHRQKEMSDKQRLEEDSRSLALFMRNYVVFDENVVEQVSGSLSTATASGKEREILSRLEEIANHYFLNSALSSATRREVFSRMMSALMQVRRRKAVDLLERILEATELHDFTSYDDDQMRQAAMNTGRVLDAEKAVEKILKRTRWNVSGVSTPNSARWFRESSSELAALYAAMRRQRQTEASFDIAWDTRQRQSGAASRPAPGGPAAKDAEENSPPQAGFGETLLRAREKDGEAADADG